MKNVVDINTLQLKMLISYAKKVSLSEQKNASRHVVKCCEYIFKHLYDELSLAILANHLSLSPNYLSELFHKEMKISVTDYINQQRVSEAKNLLCYTDKTIIDICTILNFRSQSYFSTVFKKYAGTSPATYRKNHIN